MSIHFVGHRNSTALWKAQINNNNNERNTKENNILI